MQNSTLLRWLLPATLPLLAAPALALQGGANPVLIEQVTAPTGTGCQAPATGVLATTVQGAYPDLWSLQSGTIFRSHEVGLFDGYQSVAAPAAALATLPGGGPASGTDGVVSVGTRGVELWTVLAAGQSPQVTLVDASYGAGIAVRCGDVTGDGLADIVVLDQGRTQLRVYSKNGTWSLAGTISPAGVTISGFDLGQLDTVGTRLELLTAVQDGARAYSLTGPTGGSFAATSIMERAHELFTENYVVAIKNHVSAGIDGLAWATRVGASTTRLLTSASFAIPGVQPVVALAAGLTVQGLTSGPLDFVPTNGTIVNRGDVVVNYLNSDLVEYFVNRGPGLLDEGFTRLAPWSGTLDITTADTNSFGTPVIGDIDGDGWGDILSGAVNGTLNSLWMGLDPASGSSFGNGTPTLFELYLEPTGDPEVDGYLHWGVDELINNANVTAALQVENTAMAINVGLWRQVDGLGDFVALGTSRCDTPEVSIINQTGGLVGVSINQADLGSSNPSVFEVGGDVFALRVQPQSVLSDGTRPFIWVALANYTDVLPETLPDWHNNPSLDIRTAQTPFFIAVDTPNEEGIGEVIPAIEVRRVKTPQGTPPTPHPNPSVGCVPGAGS